jgi:hypothetical protein
MSIPVVCPKCGKPADAPASAEGNSVACSGCGVSIQVPRVPVAAVAATEPTRPTAQTALPEAQAGLGMSLWAWRGLEVAVFVGICVVFAFIGAASNQDEPGLAASRMARNVGAPIALVLIGAAELGLWLWKSQQAATDQDNRRR